MIAALGIFPLIAIVIKRAVDVPYWDEWEWAELAFAAHRHTLTFARLWQPHNEHRILVPNLMMLGLDAFGGWTPVREQLLSLGLLALTQLCVWLLIRRTVPAAWRGICFLGASVLLLGLVQYENLDWGFQMAWFVCDLAAVAVVLLLTRARGSTRDLMFAAAVAAVASLSSSQGLIAWPIGLLAIALVPRRPIARGLAWVATGSIVTLIVRAGAPTASEGHVGFTHVALLGRYVLAYLGAPFAMSFGVTASIAVGAVLIVWIVVLASFAARAPLDRRVRLAPWLALTAYPLLSAIATASARGGLGLAQATSSRYTSITTLGWIAALAATCIVVPRVARLPALRAAVVSGAIAVLVLASAKQSAAGNYDWRLHAADLRAARAAIAAGDSHGLLLVYPHPELAIDLLRELAEVKDGVFREGAGAR